MSRIRRRPVALAAGLFAVLVVVALGLVLPRDRPADRPDFRIGDETASFPDGEGLMGGRRTARARIDDTGFPQEIDTIERVGPGSVVLGFRTVVLDRDANPVRIRQHTSADLLPYADVRATIGVGWQGYVATQQVDRTPRTSGGKEFEDAVGPWRAAGDDGILVRPGEQVRLRTRYDLRPRGKATCRTLTLPDGPLWEAREAGGPWRTLEARDDSGSETRDVPVRTGQFGIVTFRASRACDGDRTGSGTEIRTDGARSPEDLYLDAAH